MDSHQRVPNFRNRLSENTGQNVYLETKTNSAHFIEFRVCLSLSIWELNGSLAIHANFLYSTVTKYTFLCSVWVQILYRLIWEDNFFSPIGIMLLNLFAKKTKVKLDMKRKLR